MFHLTGVTQSKHGINATFSIFFWLCFCSLDKSKSGVKKLEHLHIYAKGGVFGPTNQLEQSPLNSTLEGIHCTHEHDSYLKVGYFFPR